MSTIEIASLVVSITALGASFLIPLGVSIAVLIKHISKSDCFCCHLETRADDDSDIHSRPKPIIVYGNK